MKCMDFLYNSTVLEISMRDTQLFHLFSKHLASYQNFHLLSNFAQIILMDKYLTNNIVGSVKSNLKSNLNQEVHRKFLLKKFGNFSLNSEISKSCKRKNFVPHFISICKRAFLIYLPLKRSIFCSQSNFLKAFWDYEKFMTFRDSC